MSARILDGKRIADELLDGLKARIDARLAAGGSRPGLAVVLVGADPASQSYVRNKRRAADKVGIRLSPFGIANDSGEDDTMPLYSHLIRELDKLGRRQPRQPRVDQGR